MFCGCTVYCTYFVCTVNCTVYCSYFVCTVNCTVYCSYFVCTVNCTVYLLCMYCVLNCLCTVLYFTVLYYVLCTLFCTDWTKDSGSELDILPTCLNTASANRLSRLTQRITSIQYGLRFYSDNRIKVNCIKPTKSLSECLVMPTPKNSFGAKIFATYATVFLCQ